MIVPEICLFLPDEAGDGRTLTSRPIGGLCKEKVIERADSPCNDVTHRLSTITKMKCLSVYLQNSLQVLQHKYMDCPHAGQNMLSVRCPV